MGDCNNKERVCPSEDRRVDTDKVGTQPVTPFTKFDGDKIRLELLEPEFIKGIGKIITFGANKYSADNWKKADGEDITRIKGALLRHLYAYLGGEEFDPETGESHLYHAGCNLMFLDYFDRTNVRDYDGPQEG